MPNTGWPCSSAGTNGSGGAVMTAQPVDTSSGAASAQSRQRRRTSGARSIGNTVSPACTIGPSGCRRNSNSVTMPKLPPPPRMPQNRSACSRSVARTTLPSARTTSAEMRLSQARPYLEDVQP